MRTENHPIFISEWIYKSVQNRNFNINETLRLIHLLKYGVSNIADIKKSPISAKSLYETTYMNAVCASLFEIGFQKEACCMRNGFRQLISEDVEDDCKRQTKSFLFDNENAIGTLTESYGNDLVPVPTPTEHPDARAPLYYELQVTQDGLLIVVVKSGFLNHLVETKDNYLQFVLKCLELSYNRSPKVADETTNGLLALYLHYNTGRNFEALFRAKTLAALS